MSSPAAPGRWDPVQSPSLQAPPPGNGPVHEGRGRGNDHDASVAIIIAADVDPAHAISRPHPAPAVVIGVGVGRADEHKAIVAVMEEAVVTECGPGKPGRESGMR